MRRRPLLRAAMVGGGAYMAGKHVQRGQERESEQQQRLDELEQSAPPAGPAPAAPAQATAPAVDVVGQLTQLKGLLDAGALTQAEFDAQKRKLLGEG